MDAKGLANQDHYLWNDFRSGNDQAFEKIYTIFVDILYRYGQKFTKDDQLVKDCIQELFIEIYHRRNHLGQTNNIKLYLLKSLKRSILKSLRTNIEFSSIDDAGIPFLIAYSDNDNNLEEEQNTLKTTAIEKALAELTPRQKEAIYLRYYIGLPYEEIGEILDLNYQSVRNLVFRAVEKLRIVLSNSNLILFTLITRI